MRKTEDIIREAILPEVISIILSNANPLKKEDIFEIINGGLGMRNVSFEDVSSVISLLSREKKIEEGERGFSLSMEYIKKRFSLA